MLTQPHTYNLSIPTRWKNVPQQYSSAVGLYLGKALVARVYPNIAKRDKYSLDINMVGMKDNILVFDTEDAAKVKAEQLLEYWFKNVLQSPTL